MFNYLFLLNSLLNLLFYIKKIWIINLNMDVDMVKALEKFPIN